MKIGMFFVSSGFTLALTVSGAPVSAQAYEVDAFGMPILNSNPSAIGVAFIDFDGGMWSGTERGAYDLDGDPTTFNAAEQDDIYNAWLDVSTHFAMFDINVTTVAPDKTVTPTAHVLVTPDMSGGAANVNKFGDTSPVARGANAAGNARNRTTGISHELGHIMGLNHQAEFDEQGNFIKAYRGADPVTNIAPIMGVDYAGKFSSWQDGFRRVGDGSGGYLPVPQSDLDVVSNNIITVYNQFTGGTYTGDGFRLDEYGNDFATATFLVEGTSSGNGNNKVFDPVDVAISGIIERHSDVDMFEVIWAGGDFIAFVEGQRNVAANPEFASSLGMDLALFDERGGKLVAEDLSLDPADTDASLSLIDLKSGTYYLAVSSAGDYDDLGAYNLTLTNGLAAAAVPVPEPSSLALLGLAGVLVARRRRG